MQYCFWNLDLCGVGTWTLQKVDMKCLESFEMSCWRRMERVMWVDLVKIKKYYKESNRKGIIYM
jgi:hypothetical protein